MDGHPARTAGRRRRAPRSPHAPETRPELVGLLAEGLARLMTRPQPALSDSSPARLELPPDAGLSEPAAVAAEGGA